MWLAAGTGFVMGLQHAADADHVVAVSTIVSRTRKARAPRADAEAAQSRPPSGDARGTAQSEARAAWLIGAAWGAGHTLTLLVAGGALVLMRRAMPESLAHGLEFAVGVVLIVLGLAAIAGSVSRGGLVRHRHEHGHDDGHGHHLGSPAGHSHEHEHLPALEAVARSAGAPRLLKSLGLGMLHGLAGSSALSLALLAAMPGPAAALAYLLVFGLGTLAGMSLLSAAMSWSMLRLSTVGGLERWLQPLVGTLSAAVGAAMVLRESGL